MHITRAPLLDYYIAFPGGKQRRGRGEGAGDGHANAFISHCRTHTQAHTLSALIVAPQSAIEQNTLHVLNVCASVCACVCVDKHMVIFVLGLRFCCYCIKNTHTHTHAYGIVAYLARRAELPDRNN